MKQNEEKWEALREALLVITMDSLNSENKARPLHIAATHAGTEGE